MEQYYPAPGDLCQYMSRVLLVVNEPYYHLNGRWVETIEIEDNEPRKVLCKTLTLIQRANKES